jgi:hypothetical protein
VEDPIRSSFFSANESFIYHRFILSEGHIVAMNRSERLRLRAASFQRRGRAPGKVPFGDDKKRFELVICLALMARYHIGAHKAAEIAVLIVSSRQPLQLTSVDSDYQKLSAAHQGLRHRSEYLVRSLNGLDHTVVRNVDHGWLAGSFWYVCCLLNAFEKRLPYRVYLKCLCDLGWRPVLEALAPRLELPLQVPQADGAEIERFYTKLRRKMA